MSEYIPRDSLSSKQLRRKIIKYEEKLVEKNKKTQIINIRKLLSDLKYNLAKKSIDEYIKMHGYDCYINDVYGKYYLCLNNYEEAKKYYLANIESNSENKYYSLYELGKIKKYEQDYEEAAKCMMEILNSNHPDKKHAKLELAKVYILDEKYDDAEEILNEMIESDLLNKNHAYEALIQLKINSGKYIEAKKLVEDLEGIISSAQSKLFKGQIERKKGKYKAAREYFNEILLNENEGKIRATYELAGIEMETENYSGALKLLDKILANKNFLYNEALECKIDCYLKNNRVEEAKFLIENSLEIDDKSRDVANFYLGLMEFHNNNYDKAINYFNKVTKRNKRAYRDMIYKKICISIKLEKIKEAEQLFLELKDIDYSKKYFNKYNILEIYISKKMNREKEEPTSYLSSLIYEYDKDLAIEHIKKHKEEDNSKENHTIFYENINICELYDFAFQNISEDNYLENSFCDVYLLEYENVGYNEEKTLNYIKVVTLPNSKEIVTIYPYDVYLKYKKDKPKTKKLSRIDKFNKKYGIS